jgi:hypothetical protein
MLQGHELFASRSAKKIEEKLFMRRPVNLRDFSKPLYECASKA